VVGDIRLDLSFFRHFFTEPDKLAARRRDGSGTVTRLSPAGRRISGRPGGHTRIELQPSIESLPVVRVPAAETVA